MWLPNFGYHFARLEGDWRRKAYRARLPAIVRRPVQSPRAVPFRVYAYSSEAAMPEQVRSIRSFLQHVGRPIGFHVVSAGSHSAASRQLLRQIDPIVSVEDSGAELPADLPGKFQRYLTTHPYGKQLALIMSLPRTNEPVLYADSDILFFSGARDLVHRVAEAQVAALYLPDCHGLSADPRLFRAEGEERNPANTGLLLLFQKLDWSLGIARFEEMAGDPIMFTNQTIVHLVLHANGARPLDARKYVLQLDDQTIYPDRYASPELALRHYVNPVRHKFWTTTS